MQEAKTGGQMEGENTSKWDYAVNRNSNPTSITAQNMSESQDYYYTVYKL